MLTTQTAAALVGGGSIHKTPTKDSTMPPKDKNAIEYIRITRNTAIKSVHTVEGTVLKVDDEVTADDAALLLNHSKAVASTKEEYDKAKKK